LAAEKTIVVTTHNDQVNEDLEAFSKGEAQRAA